MNETELEFISYLKSTLIPDPIESGRHETAVDFKAAIGICERLEKELKDTLHLLNHLDLSC